MFPRSSSTSSCRQSLNENHPLPHYESLQNLHQGQRQKTSHPLTLDNNHLNLPVVPDPIKENAAIKPEHLVVNEEKPDQLRRTIIQDDIENIQERLNEMLIAVPSIDENEKQFLKQEKSTNEYFTPKVSIGDEDEEQFDCEKRSELFR